MFIIIIAGPPGSGKGTQARLLADSFNYAHLSTGEMLRKEIASGSGLGKLAQSRIDNGNFVPDYVACEMVKNYLHNNKGLQGVIFDGFPRTVKQCFEFDPILAGYNTKVHMFIDINVDKENLTKRLIDRNMRERRPDDSDISIIEHRFGLYNDLTRPVINFYKNKNNYHQLDGNDGIMKVHIKLKELINNYVEA